MTAHARIAGLQTSIHWLCGIFVLFVCAHAQAQSDPGGVHGSRTYLGLSVLAGDSTAWLVGTTDNTGAFSVDTFPAVHAYGSLGTLNYHPTLPANTSTPTLPIDSTARERLSVLAVVGPRSRAAERLLFSLGDHDTTRLAFTTRRVLRTGDMAYLNELGVPGQAALLGYSERNEVEHADAMELRLGNGFMQPALPLDTGHCTIPELHLHYRVISKLERLKVQSYLAMKYGITMKGVYVNSAGDTLWNTASADGFGSRVIALGRDTASGLDQKQSTSSAEPEVLVLAADTITAWNQTNPATLQEGEFVLCGDDDGLVKWAPRQPGNPQMLRRHWLVQRTGAVMQHGRIRFNRRAITNAPEIAERFWLVVDRSGSGSFALGSTDFIEASRVLGDSLLDVANVIWDNEHSGKDLFTLAVGGNFIPTTWIDQPVCEPASNGVLHIGVQGGDPGFAFDVTGVENAFHRSWTSESGAIEHIIDVEPGEYRLRISDATGYTIDDELWVQPLDAPAIPLQPEYTLHAETPLELNARVEGTFVTYAWEREGVIIGTGPALLVDRTGHYQCTVVVDGCSARKYFTVNSTSEDGPFEMAVLPNPAAGHFVVQVSMLTEGDARLLITDPMGKPAISRKLSGMSFYRVEEHLIVPGLYTVIVEVNGKARSQKLVIM